MVECFVFLIYMYNISSTDNSDFTSSFPICIPFISFSCLASVLALYWKRVRDSGQPCLILILIELLQAFLHLWDVGRGFVICLYYVRFCALQVYSLWGLYYEGVLDSVKGFSCIYWYNPVNFSLKLFIWFSTFIKSGILKNPYISGIKPTWLGGQPFHICLYSVCKTFTEDFYIYFYQGYWPVLFFACVFTWLWY